jgi:uncharacterized protein (DUF1015 family)
MAKPMDDRLRLMRACRANLSPIWGLSLAGELGAIPTPAEPPLARCTDDDGVHHRLWPVTSPALIDAVSAAVASAPVVIADGHHRYETSWNYKQQCAKQGIKATGTETPDNVLATLVNMDDDLTIFGTHRLCYDIQNFDMAKVLNAAKSAFDIREYSFNNDQEEKAARRDLLEDLKVEGMTKPCFGAVAKGAKSHYLFVTRDVKAAAAQVKDKRSEDWRSLDVCLLHTLILEKLLGIGPEQLAAEKNVHFYRSADETIDHVRATGPYQVAFLVNPVRMEQIYKVVKNGEKFPQKSTDFYPKLLTGLLLCKLNIS